MVVLSDEIGDRVAKVRQTEIVSREPVRGALELFFDLQLETWSIKGESA